MAVVKMVVARLTLLLVLPLLLLVACASGQLATTGLCETAALNATCVVATQGCPPGTKVLEGVPMFTPWLCGGWLKICCVPDPSAPPIDDPQCGTGSPTSRVMNGFNTSPCDWPYVISIRGRVDANVPVSEANSRAMCAGVLIDKYWVLTHAICVYSTSKELSAAPSEFLVVAAEYNTEAADVDPRYNDNRRLEQFVSVSRAFVNPNFAQIRTLADLDLANNIQTNGNALALIKLAEPVVSRCASVVCLPSSSAVTSNSCDTFEQCVILGWGFTTANFQDTDGTLKQGLVRVYKDHVCDFLQTAAFSSGPARFSGSACQSSQYGQDACMGDQGGPVLCYDGARWTVQGVIPFNMCVNNTVSPYVIDVRPYERWVYDTVRNNNP